EFAVLGMALGCLGLATRGSHHGGGESGLRTDPGLIRIRGIAEGMISKRASTGTGGSRMCGQALTPNGGSVEEQRVRQDGENRNSWLRAHPRNVFGRHRDKTS